MRNGTTTLFAAMNVLDGTVIGLNVACSAGPIADVNDLASSTSCVTGDESVEC